LLILLN